MGHWAPLGQVWPASWSAVVGVGVCVVVAANVVVVVVVVVFAVPSSSVLLRVTFEAHV